MEAQEFLKHFSLDGTSKPPRDYSATLTLLGTIASAEVLHQPRSSLAGVASIKVLHQPQFFLADVASAEVLHQPPSSLATVSSATGLHPPLTAIDSAPLDNNLIACSPFDSIDNVEYITPRDVRIPPDQHHLDFEGNEIEDRRTLSDSNIQIKSTFVLAPTNKLDRSDNNYDVGSNSKAPGSDLIDNSRPPDIDFKSDSTGVCVPCGILSRDESSLEDFTPILDLPISKAYILASDITVPTSERFAQAQNTDTRLELLREWYIAKPCPSTNPYSTAEFGAVHLEEEKAKGSSPEIQMTNPIAKSGNRPESSRNNVPRPVDLGSPSAHSRRVWRPLSHRASTQLIQDRLRCAPLRLGSSQPRWLLRYLVRRNRVPRWRYLRQQPPGRHCGRFVPRPPRSRLKHETILAASLQLACCPPNQRPCCDRWMPTTSARSQPRGCEHLGDEQLR